MNGALRQDEVQGVCPPEVLWVACERAADLIEAGKGLTSETLVVGGDTRATNQHLSAIGSEIESGIPLTEALTRRAGQHRASRLSIDQCREVLQTTLQVGTRTHSLPAALRSWAQMQRDAQSEWRGTWLSLAYPALLCVIFTIALITVFEQAIPHYLAIAKDMGPLSPLLQSVEWLHKHIWVVILFTIVVLTLPFIWACHRQQLFRFGSRPSSRARLRLQAHASSLVPRMLRQSMPTEEVIDSVAAASGWKDNTNPQLLSVLESLDRGEISADQARNFAHRIADGLKQQLANRVTKDSRWLANVVTVLVAVGAISIYVGLVYLLWQEILKQLDHSTLRNL